MMRLFFLLLALVLAGCGGGVTSSVAPSGRIALPTVDLPPTASGREVAMYALGLIGVRYRFGGKNPEAGVDCSGMVSYIYGQAARRKIEGSAASLARQGRRVASEFLRAGDLVFFNTRNRPHSHVGIYIGGGRFVHAPSTNGQVRIDELNSRYFSQRFEEARTYFD